MKETKNNTMLQKIVDSKEIFAPKLDMVDSFRVFGSVARNEHTLDSDVDFLLTFKEEPTLIDLLFAEEILEDVLDTEVDVVSFSSLTDDFAHVLEEGILV